MPMFMKEHKDYFDGLFNEYKDACADLVLDKDKLAKTRKFRLRIRLNLGTHITVDTEYARAKTLAVKQTYLAIFKIVDAWFVYEAFLKFGEDYKLIKKNATKFDIFTEETVKICGISDIIDDFNDLLNKIILAHTARRHKLIKYIVHTISNSKGNKLIAVLNKVRDKLADSKPLELKEILAFIYGVRNNYVHDGELAYEVIESYSTKTAILRISYDFLILLMLKVAIHIMKDITENH